MENISDEISIEYDSESEQEFFPGYLLKQDYILLNIIGKGNNAKVWIVYKISTKSFLAMKIQDYRCYHDGCREIVIIKKINQWMQNNLDTPSYCINMLESFVHKENDNKYVCSTYQLYAGNLRMIIESGKHKYGLPIDVVKNITKQLLIALSIIHDDLHIIHTDVKPDNILFKGILEKHQKVIDLFIESNFENRYQELVSLNLPPDIFLEQFQELALMSVSDISNLDFDLDGSEEFIPDEDEVYSEENLLDEYFEEEEEEEIVEKFNARNQSVDDLIEFFDYKAIHNLDETDYDFCNVLNNKNNTTDHSMVVDDNYVYNCEIALTDFGNSYFYDKRTKNEIQDRRYRAPEIILDFNYDYSCDIWSVGCIVFELATGFTLFEPDIEPLNKDIHHLYLLEKLIGPIPLSMKTLSKRSKFLFDKNRNYHIKNVAEFESFPLKERLIKQFLIDESDADDLANFILCCLIYDYHKRPSAKNLLSHKWLN